MKPLTIEQLKALEAGDWVYIVPSDRFFTPYYAQIEKYADKPLDKELWANGQTNVVRLYYSDYGKTWLAYKNKEQAEAKGEIVELPCKVGDIVYAVMEIDYKYKIVEFTANKIVVGECGNFYFDTPTSYSHRLKFGYSVFADKSEAERRLAEVTGK